MKAVFYCLVVVAAAAFGVKYYYEQQITRNLDQASTALEPFAEFTYEKANFTKEGNISISGVSFSPKVEGGVEFSIDEFLLRTESFMGVYKLEKQLKMGDVPEHVGISIKGLKISAEDLKDPNPEKPSQEYSFAGCGDIQNFYTYNQKNLKLAEIQTDLDLDIYAPKETRSVTFKSELSVKDLYSLDLKFDIYSGVYGLDRESLPKIQTLAEFDGFEFNYKDLGFAQGVMDFCATHTGMSKASYIAYHVNAWIKKWAKKELIPDAAMAEAYITYLENPKSFSIKIKPIGRLKLTDMAATPLNLLVYQITSEVAVNGGASSQVAFSLTKARANALARESKPKEVEKPKVVVESGKPTPTKITEATAKYFLQRPINIELKNGKTYTGKILLVTAKKIDLERKIGGGKFVMPILLDHIKSFELLD